jgi:hypothetical protein
MLAAHGSILLPSAASVRAVAVLRQRVSQCHADLDGAAAAWLGGSPRSANGWSSPVRLYVHALCIEDITLQSVLREVAPLFTWLWPDLSGPPDAAALGQYARAVYASTDVYLVKLSADGLNQVVDLTKLGLGRRTVLWVMRRFVVTELGRIYGVISGATAPSRAPTAHQRLPDASRRQSRMARNLR